VKIDQESSYIAALVAVVLGVFFFIAATGIKSEVYIFRCFVSGWVCIGMSFIFGMIGILFGK
jgi:hypothetical protein